MKQFIIPAKKVPVSERIALYLDFSSFNAYLKFTNLHGNNYTIHPSGTASDISCDAIVTEVVISDSLNISVTKSGRLRFIFDNEDELTKQLDAILGPVLFALRENDPCTAVVQFKNENPIYLLWSGYSLMNYFTAQKKFDKFSDKAKDGLTATQAFMEAHHVKERAGKAKEGLKKGARSTAKCIGNVLGATSKLLKKISANDDDSKK